MNQFVLLSRWAKHERAWNNMTSHNITITSLMDIRTCQRRKKKQLQWKKNTLTVLQWRKYCPLEGIYKVLICCWRMKWECFVKDAKLSREKYQLLIRVPIGIVIVTLEWKGRRTCAAILKVDAIKSKERNVKPSKCGKCKIKIGQPGKWFDLSFWRMKEVRRQKKVWAKKSGLKCVHPLLGGRRNVFLQDVTVLNWA